MARYSCSVCGCLYEGNTVPSGFKCVLCGAEGRRFLKLEETGSRTHVQGGCDGNAGDKGREEAS